MKIFIKQNEWADIYEIYITDEDYNGKRYLAKPMELEFTAVEEGKSYEPSLRIARFFGKSTNFLQALSDALAQCGYEPKTIEENKGELKASKYHLEDLRKLLKLK